MPRVQFEWDPHKDAANQRKHKVSFADAQFAFADPQRSPSISNDTRRRERSRQSGVSGAE